MQTIKGFSTKNKDWHKSLINEVVKQGGLIVMPFTAIKMKVEYDPFADCDKNVFVPLTYEIEK